MRAYDIIEKKKKNKELTKQEIEFIVDGYTKGEIPDYQVSALMMAIYFNGMNTEEISALTMAMVNSGDQMDLSPINGIKVDKHSTGGVGDKTTIVLAPIVATLGGKVAKMSGRGLGHTGGTIDKLESFEGFRVELTEEEFFENVNNHNIAVAGQSGDLAPADKKLYALRDVTATVDSIPLIASSIMSKKIASGADAICLDVKCGTGAFMKNLEDAKELAKTMTNIGNHVGRKTMAVISDMNQPLGYAVGNSLEVIEAINTLKGKGPQDLTELTITLGSNMLVLAGVYDNIDTARRAVEDTISTGKAIDKLKEWVELQGGDKSAIDDIDRLPKAAYSEKVIVNLEGYVKEINTEEIGRAALVLGAGRENKQSRIDLSAGLVIHKKIGDEIAGDLCIATIYYNDKSKAEEAKSILIDAYTISSHEVDKQKLIYEVII